MELTRAQIKWSKTILAAIRAYFYSGWAFFIPYLAAYLLYPWLNWPVNPVGPVATGQSLVVDRPWSLGPSHLQAYWFLHAIHLILGGIALTSWWQNQKQGPPVQPSESAAVERRLIAGSAPSAFSFQPLCHSCLGLNPQHDAVKHGEDPPNQWTASGQTGGIRRCPRHMRTIVKSSASRRWICC